MCWSAALLLHQLANFDTEARFLCFANNIVRKLKQCCRRRATANYIVCLVWSNWRWRSTISRWEKIWKIWMRSNDMSRFTSLVSSSRPSTVTHVYCWRLQPPSQTFRASLIRSLIRRGAFKSFGTAKPFFRWSSWAIHAEQCETKKSADGWLLAAHVINVIGECSLLACSHITYLNWLINYISGNFSIKSAARVLAHTEIVRSTG